MVSSLFVICVAVEEKPEYRFAEPLFPQSRKLLAKIRDYSYLFSGSEALIP